MLRKQEVDGFLAFDIPAHLGTITKPLPAQCDYSGVDDEYDGYDVAQVCPNGHVATSHANSMPQFKTAFCEECGEATITACPSCQRPIRGAYLEGYAIGGTYDPPAFCRHCGKPYPWTERRLKAAREFALEVEGLDEKDRQELADTLDDLVRDVPRTQLAAGRFKRLVAMAGIGTANALKDILVDIASETAKKAIWP